jgi:hypothetical protein
MEKFSMKKIAFALLVCAFVSAVEPAYAAWPRRFRNVQPVLAKPVKIAPAYNAPVQYGSSNMGGVSAQDVANMMASRRQCAHFLQGQAAAIPYNYEGVGMAGIRQAAMDSCCYSNSGRTVVDSGCAQGADGYWYCCKRYQ